MTRLDYQNIISGAVTAPWLLLFMVFVSKKWFGQQQPNTFTKLSWNLSRWNPSCHLQFWTSFARCSQTETFRPRWTRLPDTPFCTQSPSGRCSCQSCRSGHVQYSWGSHDASGHNVHRSPMRFNSNWTISLENTAINNPHIRNNSFEYVFIVLEIWRF